MREEIRGQWESYQREVVPAGVSTIQTAETQKAFYAGAKAVLYLLRLNGQLNDNLYPVLLEQELNAFAAKVDALS